MSDSEIDKLTNVIDIAFVDNTSKPEGGIIVPPARSELPGVPNEASTDQTDSVDGTGETDLPKPDPDLVVPPYRPAGLG